MAIPVDTETYQQANNGFFSYGGDPSETGVLDARPTAFNGFFNDGYGMTRTPAFDSLMDTYRSAVVPLSDRISRTGDLSAIRTRGDVEDQMLGLRHLYDIGVSVGVNDRTATDAVRATIRMREKLAGKLGSSDTAFANRYQEYIATQAKNRGYSVGDLEAEENELGDAFLRSMASHRQNRLSSGTSGSSARYADMLADTPGSVEMLSLKARQSLQDYESRHGLYSLEDRMAVLDETARLIDRAFSNDTLRARYGGRIDQLVDMAAKKVLNGDLTPNTFDRIDGAVESISNGYVTYTGSSYGDSSGGFAVHDRDGREIRSGLSGVVSRCLMDQAIEDEANGHSPDQHVARLRKRLEGTLSEYFRFQSNGFSDAVVRDVYGKMADKIVDMDRNGHVNLSELSKLYLDGEAQKVYDSVKAPLQSRLTKTDVFGTLQDVGNDVIDLLVGGRPRVYGGAWHMAGMFTVPFYQPFADPTGRDRAEEKAAYTDPERVKAQIVRTLDERMSAKGISEDDRKRYGKYIGQMADWLTNTVVDVNTMESGNLGPDPKNYVSDTDVKNIKDRAVRAMASQLAIASKLSELGFEGVPVSFGRIDRDGKSPLRNYADRRDPYVNAFGGLVSYLQDYVGKVDPGKLTEQDDIVRYQTALSYMKGLQSVIDSSIDTGKEPDGKKVRERRQEVAKTMLGFNVDGGSSNDLNLLDPSGLAAVRDSWSARQSEAARAVAAERSFANGNPRAENQAMLNRILIHGFSDKVNPVLDERMRTVAGSLFEKYGGSFLEGNTAKGQLGYVMNAVGQAMRDLGILTEDRRNGEPVVAFDPIANIVGSSELETKIEKLIAPVLRDLARVSDGMQKQKNRALAEKDMTRKITTETVNQMKEDGTLPTQSVKSDLF